MRVLGKCGRLPTAIPRPSPARAHNAKLVLFEPIRADNRVPRNGAIEGVTMKKFGLFCAAVCLVAAMATACGGSNPSTQERETGTATLTASPTASEGKATTAAQAAAATITIANMSFGEPVTVSPGA